VKNCVQRFPLARPEILMPKSFLEELAGRLL